MIRNSKTTLAELNAGDRFYFITDKKRMAYQVTESMGTGKAYNETSVNGWIWKFDKVCPGSRAVVFLRSVLN